MFTFRWLKAGLVVLLLYSCGKPLPALDDVDLQAWKDDKLACSGKRDSMFGTFEKQKEKLLGLSEQDVISLLGKPDENELYTRNQKFYYYYVQPSKACKNSPSEHSKKLVVRFNATGLAKEVGVE
jgi:hypothetical protein